MEAFGHEVKLIAPQYVAPFVKRQKNDTADSEAIVIAARQPEMRFVELNTVMQQSRAGVFLGRTQKAVRTTSVQLAIFQEGIDWRHPDWGAPPACMGQSRL